MGERLRGKRVLLTGAGGLMGSAIARSFAAEGADLILTTRTAAKLAPLADELETRGTGTATIAADFTRDDDVDHLATAAWDAFGRVDVVLLSSQPPQPSLGSLIDCPDAAWQDQMHSIVWGPLRLMRQLAPKMIAAGGGSIVAFTSSTGFDPMPGYGAYGMAKAALWTLTCYMAKEWGHGGIRANAFQPGLIATDDDAEARTALVKPSGTLDRTALGRVGINADCMGALIYLASDESRFTSGSASMAAASDERIDMTEIKGRAAVVTGAGSGIGKGIAKALAREGAAVAVADIMFDNARAVIAEIEAEGGRAVAIHCDVCERASIHAMKAEAEAALGPISLVFANAGATSFTRLAEMSEDDIDWIIQVNLMGVMWTTRAFLPDMIASGKGGHICATASMAGLLPGWIPVHAPYSAAKAGIIGLMMNLAVELEEHDIHTTSYCPGAVASGMKANNGRYRPDRFGGPEQAAPVQFGDGDNHVHTLRFYHPDAIAPMVLNAVRNNRPFVFDHADQRRHFEETYSSVVEGCYDDIERWEREHGLPDANPTGAELRG